MKSTCTFILLMLVWASVPAQELDSLKAIMGVEGSGDNKENQVHNEGQTYSPVTVYDNGDEVKVNLGDKEMFKVVEAGDSTYVKVGKNKMVEVYDHPDSTRIRLGNKEISIVENNNKSDIHIGRVKDREHHGYDKFRGHWTGIELGLNNFLDEDLTLSREDGSSFMDLNTSRSTAVNLNFAQFSLGFGTSYFGAVTGLGIEFNNYFFDNNNTIAEVNDLVLEVPLNGENLTKSKLTTTFLRIPLMLEGQFPKTNRGKRVFVSAGVIAGVKLGSHTKVVYNNDGKDKSKDKDDFNINPFRYGLSARLGYGCIALYADYYFTPMFVREKGPELHPFNVGLALSF
jgi:hypothetical protein